MLFEADYLRNKYQAGMPYHEFVQSGESEGHHMKWHQRYEALALDDAQKQLVQSFTREMYIITLTGTWCGDCALQGAALARIVEGNPDKIHLRFLPRDPHADMMVKLKINGGFRVPVTFFCAEDFEPIRVFGDRTLSRYRAMAANACGPKCPPMGSTGLPNDPVRTVLQEMIDETERVHLVCRTSARLCVIHGD